MIDYIYYKKLYIPCIDNFKIAVINARNVDLATTIIDYTQKFDTECIAKLLFLILPL